MSAKTQVIECGRSIALQATDRLFLGEGLFETIRVVNQMPCYSKLHWQRMHRAARQLNISFDLSHSVWNAQLKHCILNTQIEIGGIKVVLSNGPAPRGLGAVGENSFLLFNPFAYSAPQQALHLMSSTWLRDANNPIYQFKTINYLESILAYRQAIAQGADDVLFYNVLAHATETTHANLFIIKNEQIFTPHLSSGLLAGIIRSRVLNLCSLNGIKCVEVAINKNEILGADAVFVTNSLLEIRSVGQLDNIYFQPNHPLVHLLKSLLDEDSDKFLF